MSTTVSFAMILLSSSTLLQEGAFAARDVAQSSSGVFGGAPAFVREACGNWCNNNITAYYNPTDAREACDACHAGPQTNPQCIDRDCGFCERQIVFPRSYPTLWMKEPSFRESMWALQGKTRCWCDTGCPMYSAASRLFCRSPCSAVCDENARITARAI